MALSHAEHHQQQQLQQQQLQPQPQQIPEQSAVPHFLPVIDSIQGSFQDEEPMLLLEDDDEDLVNSGA